MFERALVSRPGREQQHAELGPVARRGEALDDATQLGEKRRDAFHVVLAKQIGKRAPHDEAILERVARARRRLRPIGIDREPAGCIATDVDRIEVEPLASHRFPAMARAKKVRMTEDDLRGQKTLAQEPLLAVAVGDHRVEQTRALAQPHAEALPLRALDDERDGVELPGAIGPFRNAEDVERHLLFGDATSNRLSQLLEVSRRVLAQELREKLLVGAHPSLRVAVLVERALGPYASWRSLNRRCGLHQGVRRRRSTVMGKCGSISGTVTPKVPGMCHILSKRAMRRLSAAAALTGRSVADRPPGCTTW